MWPHHKIKSFVPRNPWLLQNKNYSDHDELWLRSHWLGRFSDQFSKDICIPALPAGSGEPASLRLLHMETCSWMTGWSLRGSIMLTSFCLRAAFWLQQSQLHEGGYSWQCHGRHYERGLVIHYRCAHQGFVVLANHELQFCLDCNNWQVAETVRPLTSPVFLAFHVLST